ncbi:MAG: 3-hydroxybutyryl-CoA dehydrogenase [Phycisphaeraceae bacterium]|nr:3-hydroxybutyryl-CoA dehydrogenase [Phycisphaeraceae bacterium]
MNRIEGVAVIGAGTMGSGIAYVAAQAGMRAWQIDVAPAQLERAREYHAKTASRSVEKGRMSSTESDALLSRITYHGSMAQGAAAGLAVEAATENPEIKRRIFEEMARTFPESTVLATNTSSISITSIGAAVGPGADRVVGMHFFNPVPVMKLVEVIRGLMTSDETVARTVAVAERLGKVPIPAHDRAGFVSNRVLMPMINEAFYAWMEGVAEPKHIDEIMKLGCNFPMGPLRLADFIGLDVCHDILMVLFRELGQDRYFPCPLLRQLVTAGRLGDKSGGGVYDHPQ